MTLSIPCTSDAQRLRRAASREIQEARKHGRVETKELRQVMERIRRWVIVTASMFVGSGLTSCRCAGRLETSDGKADQSHINIEALARSYGLDAATLSAIQSHCTLPLIFRASDGRLVRPFCFFISSTL